MGKLHDEIRTIETFYCSTFSFADNFAHTQKMGQGVQYKLHQLPF